MAHCMSQFLVDTFPVGVFQCNCSILIDNSRKEALVVDPGDDAAEILDRLRAHGCSVSALWHTHAHIDHIGATRQIYEAFLEINKALGREAPKIFLHPEDRWLYDHVDIQASMLGLPGFEVSTDLSPIRSGQTYEGWPTLKAHHTPGHTPGSCCLHFEQTCDVFVPEGFRHEVESPRSLLFSGDTLFRRGVGRTDLWGGNSSLLTQSIQKKLYTLPDETVVIPGHGPLTLIAAEKVKNPFVTSRDPA